MGMQNDALLYFRAVVDAGSIHAAARNIVIAPSALSRQIKLLEKELGRPLFQRGPQGMAPTTAGMELYDFAVRQSSETADIVRRIRMGGGAEPLDFRIACVEGTLTLTNLLTRWLPMLRRHHPNVTFHVLSKASADVAAAVASGEADVGYTFGRVARADVRELAAMPMPIRLAVPRGHRLESAEAVSLDQLVDELCVVPDNQFGIRRELDRECVKAGIDLRIAYETNSLAFALRLVEAENLISFSTSSMVGSGGSPTLVRLVGDGFNASALALVAHATTPSAQVSALRHELSMLMRAEPGSSADGFTLC